MFLITNHNRLQNGKINLTLNNRQIIKLIDLNEIEFFFKVCKWPFKRML